MAAGRHSLAWKIAAANTLLAIFAVLTVVALIYRKDRLLLEATIRRELTQALATDVLLLDGSNWDGLREGSDAQRQLGERLRTLQATNPGVARLYVLGRAPNGEPHVLVGGGIAAGSKLAPSVRASLADSLDRGVPVSTSVYEDSDGQWLSAFHPIRDRKGREVAVLGADFRASDLKVQARGKLKSTLVSGSIAVLAAVLLSFLIARGVTRPLKLVAESTAEIASGNLNVCLNMPRRDEVGELADSFNQMVERLAAAAEERDRLHQQVLDKQKLEQELNLAAVIQQSFLPVSFPWSPRYSTNARTVPAEAVGGDFYDFVELSDDRLGIVIGDVAGRGIAAAVYMARLISDFRAAAVRSASPCEALERLNQQLLSRSTRGLFVTMTYLVLDAASGELRYANGGHLPLLWCRGETGAVEVLDEDQGLPLGIATRPGLTERRLALGPRETFLLVTDGVVEGLSGGRSDLSFDKLVEVLRRKAQDDERLVDSVFEEIARVSPAEVPRDDMTVLSVCWNGEGPSGTKR